MGQILSQPVTEKATESGEDSRLAYGVSSMQGWRVSMEDAHAAVLSLVSAPAAAAPDAHSGAGAASSGAETAPANATTHKPTEDTKNAKDIAPISKNTEQVGFFAVYDGHGGERTAQYAGDKVHELVADSPAFSKGDWAQALTDGFLGFDDAMLAKTQKDGVDGSGCAATAVIITPTQVVCANAGDSRTVLARRGEAKPLSFDHKPENEGERSRINAAGGFVDMGRVNANLALSRALGDFSFKNNARLPPEQQVVTANPDIVEHTLDESDEFVLLACDGIWDCMSSQEAVEFVRRGIADELPLAEICELIMEECLAPESDMSGIGCDNMTACVVALLQPGQTLAQWYEMIGDRVARGDGAVAPRRSSEVKQQQSERRNRQSPPARDGGPGSITGSGKSQEADEDLPIPEASQLVQQLFGDNDGVVRLNPDATSLLSRIGIRLNMHTPEDEESNGNEHSGTRVTELSEAETASHEHAEDEKD